MKNLVLALGLLLSCGLVNAASNRGTIRQDGFNLNITTVTADYAVITGSGSGNTNIPLVVNNKFTYLSPYTQFIQAWKSNGTIVATLRADGTLDLTKGDSVGNDGAVEASYILNSGGSTVVDMVSNALMLRGGSARKISDNNTSFRLDVSTDIHVTGGISVNNIRNSADNIALNINTNDVTVVRPTLIADTLKLNTNLVDPGEGSFAGVWSTGSIVAVGSTFPLIQAGTNTATSYNIYSVGQNSPAKHGGYFRALGSGNWGIIGVGSNPSNEVDIGGGTLAMQAFGNSSFNGLLNCTSEGSFGTVWSSGTIRGTGAIVGTGNSALSLWDFGSDGAPNPAYIRYHNASYMGLIASANALTVSGSDNQNNIWIRPIGTGVNGGNSISTFTVSGLTMGSGQQINTGYLNVPTSAYINLLSVGSLGPQTSDGSDNSTLNLRGGGDTTSLRGAQIQLYGNELLTGNMYLTAGDAGSILFRTGSSNTNRVVIDASGNQYWGSNGTTGNYLSTYTVATGLLNLSGGFASNDFGNTGLGLRMGSGNVGFTSGDGITMGWRPDGSSFDILNQEALPITFSFGSRATVSSMSATLFDIPMSFKQPDIQSANLGYVTARQYNGIAGVDLQVLPNGTRSLQLGTPQSANVYIEGSTWTATGLNIVGDVTISSRPCAEFHYDLNASSLTQIVAGEYVVACGTGTILQTSAVDGLPLSAWFDTTVDSQGNSNRIRYVGKKSHKMFIEAAISFDSTAACVLYVQLFKNGTAIPRTKQHIAIAASAKESEPVTSGIVNMTTNDYLELRIMTPDGTDASIHLGNISVFPID